ncbi:MAG: hypothetical protein K8R25_02995 [Methanosarcinales archaeon]|nr:hypothetical protein [Methanosarcinales archaeon]
MNNLNNKGSKVFSIFFIVGLIFTILAFAIFILLYSSSGLYVHIDEIDAHAGENITYIEISKEELKEYPAVGKAINSYIETNEHEIKINMRDQGQVGESSTGETAATDSGIVAESTPTPEATSTKGTPGFGILVGIMGVLIAVYLRRK